jgi:thioredoxin-dependent peroxiredoxin
MIEAGTTAPDFTLPDQDGRPVRLSDLRGQTVVLYFYPKADTPGCTTQACGIRDHRADYEAARAVVFGVSPDPVKAVKKFADKQSLNFRLLADEVHSVCETYGVWAEKTNYGRTYWGALRTTFVIDEEGVVRHVIPKVSPKTHDEQVLALLGEMAAA